MTKYIEEVEEPVELHMLKAHRNFRLYRFLVLPVIVGIEGNSWTLRASSVVNDLPSPHQTTISM